MPLSLVSTFIIGTFIMATAAVTLASTLTNPYVEVRFGVTGRDLSPDVARLSSACFLEIVFGVPVLARSE